MTSRVMIIAVMMLGVLCIDTVGQEVVVEGGRVEVLTEADVFYEKVVESYQGVDHYLAVKDLNVTEGGKVMMAGRLNVGFDRARGRLLVGAGNVTIASDGEKIRVKLEAIRNRHVEVELAGELTVGQLRKVAAFGDSTFLFWPDVELLLGGKLKHGDDELSLSAADGQGVRRLEIVSEKKRVMLWVDEKTHLVGASRVMVYGDNGKDVVIEVDVKATVGQAADASVFDVDFNESQGVSSFDELMMQYVPAMDLEAISGKKVKVNGGEDAVVVFWVSGSEPCGVLMRELKMLQEQWKKSGRDVVIHWVNVGESRDSVRRYWRKWMMPGEALLDVKGRAAGAYRVRQVPTVVVVSKGAVVRKFVGVYAGVVEAVRSVVEGE